MVQSDPEAAREAFEHALAVDEGFVKPYLGLAQLDLQEQLWSQAAERSRQVLELDPNSAKGLFFKGLASYYLQRFDVSEKDLESLVDRGYARQFPVALFHLGMLYARKGDIPSAARMFQSYLESTPQSQLPSERGKKIREQLERWQAQGLAVSGSQPAARPDSQ